MQPGDRTLRSERPGGRHAGRHRPDPDGLRARDPDRGHHRAPAVQRAFHALMPYFQPEPPYNHGTQSRIGILLVNLGTPDAPTPQALRRYLGQFLSDRRVVEIPRPVWWLI